MHHLDNQITICPKCSGWGNISNQEGSACNECNGHSVFIETNNRNYIFDLPMYIDYGIRLKKRVLKKITIIIFALIFILLLAFLLVNIF